MATAVAALLGASCAERIAPPAAPAPSLDRPSAAIPGDLDVAVRLDLDAARRFLGPAITGAMQLDLADPGDRAATGLISDALARARVVLVAFRPGLPARSTDNVLVLRGGFAGIEPHGAPDADFGPAMDLGGGFRRYDRERPSRRSAPARIYARGDEWLVFASEAELDSTERALEQHGNDPRVDPPDRGMVSVSARLPTLVPLLTERYPAVAQALEGASSLDASADADDRGLRATIEVRFSSNEEASQAREQVRPLLEALAGAEGALGIIARGASTHALGPTVVVAVDLDARAVAALLSGIDLAGPGRPAPTRPSGS